MEKPKITELLSATNELAGIGLESLRECAADFIIWAVRPLAELVDKAQDVFGEDGE